MADKKILGVRLSEYEVDAISQMGSTPSDGVRAIIPPAGLRMLFQYSRPSGHTDGRDFMPWLVAELAATFRQRMLNDADFPCDPTFIPIGRDPEWVLLKYADFLEARDRALGMPPNPHYEEVFGEPAPHLAKSPVSGLWATLRADQQFADDGTITQAPRRAGRK